MGIKNFTKFIEKYCPNAIQTKSIIDYKNTTLVIDADLMIYKNIMALRHFDKKIEKDGKDITHLHTLELKLRGMKKYNITPIFVFDGNPPNMKSKTLSKRKSIVTYSEIEDCKTFLSKNNYKVIQAKQEADSQCVYMGYDMIVTDDPDVLLFGGKIMIKNFTVDLKKKIKEIKLNSIFQCLNINQEQLVDIGILLGCDYCDQQNSITKVYNLIKNYGSIKNMIANGVLEYNKRYPQIQIYYKYPVILS